MGKALTPHEKTVSSRLVVSNRKKLFTLTVSSIIKMSVLYQVFHTTGVCAVNKNENLQHGRGQTKILSALHSVVQNQVRYQKIDWFLAFTVNLEHVHNIKCNQRGTTIEVLQL